jgi:DNA-binding NtrC family response regulator
MSLAEAEKLLIRQTLTHITRNREEAARLLGISRRALQYKLKRYGLLEERTAPASAPAPEPAPNACGAADPKKPR